MPDSDKRIALDTFAFPTSRQFQELPPFPRPNIGILKVADFGHHKSLTAFSCLECETLKKRTTGNYQISLHFWRGPGMSNMAW